MAEYDFTLVIRGQLSEDTVEALYEAGCGDATFSECSGVVYADVTREAVDFFQAARGAIEQIESVPGLRVEAIDAGHLVTHDRNRESGHECQKAPPGDLQEPAAPPLDPQFVVSVDRIMQRYRSAWEELAHD